MDEFRTRLTEELVLLMLDESSGYLERVPGWNFSCVMAGAVVADLASEDRIETVAGVDLVGRSVATAVKDSTVKPKTRPVLLTKPIPKLPVVDILRQRDLLPWNKSITH